MADESNNEKTPEDANSKDGISDIPDIDALLLQASESLDDVESELGVDDTASGTTAPSLPDKPINEAMETVQEQVQAISEQIATETVDEQPSDASEVDAVLANLAGDLDDLAAHDSTDAAADASATEADDIDEILSVLSDEVEEMEATQDEASTDEAPEADESVEAEQSAESESVVETDEADEADSEPEEEQEQTPDDSVDENAESDDSSQAESAEEVDAEPDEEIADAEDVVDPLRDVADDVTQEEPVDDVEDDVLMQELAEKEATPAEPDEEKPKKRKRSDELPRVSRIVAQGLTAVNKPFITIDQSTKDLLGTVGVVTAIITVLTVGLFLLIK